jgi:anti-sigma B factor antagonist
VAEISYFLRVIDGVPAVPAPAEIDITTAEQLDAALFAAVSRGHMTVVLDMTRTRFCDCGAFHTLLRAHERMAADGGQLRLVIPAGGAVSRVVSLTGLGRLVCCFKSMEGALKDIGYPVRLMGGIPVVSAPAVINAVAAARLRLVLLEPAAAGHTTVVLNMTGTRFCDATALGVLIRADKRIRADGDELRLVLSAGSIVSRIFCLTGLNRFILHFGSLPDALLQQPADPTRPSGPSSSAGPGFPAAVRPGWARREPGRAIALSQFLLGICAQSEINAGTA